MPDQDEKIHIDEVISVSWDLGSAQCCTVLGSAHPHRSSLNAPILQPPPPPPPPPPHHIYI